MQEIYSDRMNAREKRASVSLAAIYTVRMLGLFMILPVFALYAGQLQGATYALMGFAVGVYGLSQSVLQIPFGMASDRWGRKPVITVGLLIFAAGSVMAAVSTDIWGVIIGRAVQGAGAIAAVVMALNADLTREEHRTKAMAVIGASIGLSFAVALVLGPVLDGLIGVNGIFWLIAGLALASIGILWGVVPHVAEQRRHRDATPVLSLLGPVLREAELQRLNVGIFTLHLALTAVFIAVPMILVQEMGLAKESLWEIYLPVMVVSMLAMVPFIIVAEKRRKMKPALLGGVAVLAVAQLLLVDSRSLWAFGASLVVFFTAFNLLEASLPSLVAKISPPESKGTAMGIYQTCQFLGAFVGGSVGGALTGAYGPRVVFLFIGLALVAWFILAYGMRNPRYLSGMAFTVGKVSAAEAPHLVNLLTGVTGVAEAVIIPEEGMAYLRVDNHALDRLRLNQMREGGWRGEISQ
ncbi:MAG: MFS transporter [Gammaproteobacteria bacterium]|nr:MFS transporter [Gammaproteobacteria bacterium]